MIEIIKTFNQLLQLNLILKSDILCLNDVAQKRGVISSSLLDNILPFLLHPNTQIREQSLTLILILCDHKKYKILSKSEVFCFVRPKLEPYFKSNEDLMLMILRPETIGSVSDSLKKLQPPLSRGIYDQYVKNGIERFDKINTLR